MEEKRNVYKILTRKPWRPRHKGKDNVKIELRGLGCEGVHCIEVMWDGIQWWAVVSTVMNLQFCKSRKFPDQLNNYEILKKNLALLCSSVTAKKKKVIDAFVFQTLS
jgi:hypothetical protein